MLSSSDKKIAQIRFSEDQLKKIAVDELLKDPNAYKQLEGKKIRVSANWHVFKWDDPDAFLTVTVYGVD